MYPSKPSEEPAMAPLVTGIPVGGAASSQQWSSGLFDCFDDCGLCCLTWWCPCITFGRVAELVDRGATSCGTAAALYALLAYFTGCQWIYSCTYRAKMRAQFGLLPNTPCCSDCLVHFCCQPCALCQQYKELQARGFDPDLGWAAQLQDGGGIAMLPPAAQGMGC